VTVDAAKSRLGAIEKAAADQAAAAAQVQLTAVRESLTASGVIVPEGPISTDVLKAAIDTRVSKGASKIVAGAGHQEPLALKPGGGAGADEDIDGLRAQLADEHDPVKRGKIAAQIGRLRFAPKAATSPAGSN
jgi:hypothetical protein